MLTLRAQNFEPLGITERLPFPYESSITSIGYFGKQPSVSPSLPALYYVGVDFESPMMYVVGSCIRTTLPIQPPNDPVDKIWTFTKTSTAFIISCNGVELVNYKFNNSNNGNCLPAASRDVEFIKFYSTDTSSNFYRSQPLEGNNKSNVIRGANEKRDLGMAIGEVQTLPNQDILYLLGASINTTTHPLLHKRNHSPAPS